MTDQLNIQAQSVQKKGHAPIPEIDQIDQIDQIWDELLSRPESHAFLDLLEEEALREYREGKTEEGGFGKEQS